MNIMIIIMNILIINIIIIMNWTSRYVSLGKVESVLKGCPVVANVCVYGDATKWLMTINIISINTQVFFIIVRIN